MNNILVDDILNIILKTANNYYCLLVCKKWYTIMVQNSVLCKKCGRILRTCSMALWDLIWPYGNYSHFDVNCYCEQKDNFDKFIMLLKKDYNNFQNIKYYCVALYLIAIKHNGHAIKYIQSYNIHNIVLLEAVKKTGSALQHISKINQNIPNICLEAIRQNGLALQYILDINQKTPNICLEAVNQNGLALQFVDNQTRNICFTAVRQNGLALQWVKNKTYAICFAAMQQNYSSSKYVENSTSRLELKKQYMLYSKDL